MLSVYVKVSLSDRYIQTLGSILNKAVIWRKWLCTLNGVSYLWIRDPYGLGGKHALAQMCISSCFQTWK